MFKALLFHQTLKDFKGPVNPGINGLGHVVRFGLFKEFCATLQNNTATVHYTFCKCFQSSCLASAPL